MVKAKSLLPLTDTTPPERSDILKLMADLRIANDSDSTLERKLMLMLARYIFTIVGDWKEKVEKSDSALTEKVEELEASITGIYREMRIRQDNTELTTALCIRLANRILDKDGK